MNNLDLKSKAKKGNSNISGLFDMSTLTHHNNSINIGGQPKPSNILEKLKLTKNMNSISEMQQ